MPETHSVSGEPAVYLGGARILPGAPGVSIEDHGVQFGLGFFETFRTSGGRPHLWPEHRVRLLAACAKAGIEAPVEFLVHDEARRHEIVHAQLRAQGLTDAVLRYTVTAGRPEETAGGVRYRRPTEWLTLRPLPDPASRAALRLLALSRDSGEWLPRPKSLNFSNALLGAHELRRRGAAPGDEGLFLARDGGFVVEAVRHNLVWISGGRAYSPDPTLGAVAGTGLQWLCASAMPVAPMRARVDDLLQAEAVLLINSVRGVTPVCELWDTGDRMRLGTWESEAHPLVAGAQRRWLEELRATAGVDAV